MIEKALTYDRESVKDITDPGVLSEFLMSVS